MFHTDTQHGHSNQQITREIGTEVENYATEE